MTRSAVAYYKELIVMCENVEVISLLKERA
jgi:hypothetical protein